MKARLEMEFTNLEELKQFLGQTTHECCCKQAVEHPVDDGEDRLCACTRLIERITEKMKDAMWSDPADECDVNALISAAKKLSEMVAA